jgi:hypothetical protein
VGTANATALLLLLLPPAVCMCMQVAAFAMGRGPLALPNCPWLQELHRFGVVLSFPVIPTAGGHCNSLLAAQQ